MISFKEYLLEFTGIHPVEAIGDFESPPFFLNPKMVERTFNIPNQHAVHGISINNLLNNFPDVIGRAKAVSTFTHLDTLSNPFFGGGGGSVDPDNPVEAFVLVKGRVTGKFNMDVYSALVKGGRRMLMLNDDTIEDSDLDDKHIDALSDFANDMRTYVGNTISKMTDEEFDIDDEEYPDVEELEGRQKYELVKGYMDKQEKLLNSKKYKEAFMHFMVLQKDKRQYGYNELTLDKVQPLAIYLKGPFSSDENIEKIKSIKAFNRIPIKQNVKEADIDRITKKMR